jgi:hypothetical protein
VSHTVSVELYRDTTSGISMNKPGLEMLHARADAALMRFKQLEKIGSARDRGLAKYEMRQVMSELAHAGLDALMLKEIGLALRDPEPEVTAPKLKFAGAPMQKSDGVSKYNAAKKALDAAKASGDLPRIEAARKVFVGACRDLGIEEIEAEKLGARETAEFDKLKRAPALSKQAR